MVVEKAVDAGILTGKMFDYNIPVEFSCDLGEQLGYYPQ